MAKKIVAGCALVAAAASGCSYLVYRRRRRRSAPDSPTYECDQKPLYASHALTFDASVRGEPKNSSLLLETTMYTFLGALMGSVVGNRVGMKAVGAAMGAVLVSAVCGGGG